MSQKTAKWYLKKKNNTQYGPVSLEEMAIWAEQCRIVAGNQASTDRETWINVEDIPELAMDWLARRKDGKQYGPFPLSALPELLNHRVLPKDAILTHRESDETMTMHEALESLDQVDEQDMKSQEEIELQEETGAQEEAGAQDVTGLQEVTSLQEVTGPEEQIEAQEVIEEQEESTFKKDAGQQLALETELAALREAAAKQQQALEEQIENLRQEATGEKHNLEEQIATLRQEAAIQQQEREEQITTLQAEMAALQEERDAQQEAARQAVAEREEQYNAEISRITDALQQAQDQNRKILSQDSNQQVALAELRQQVAFMKKNTAALNAELLTVRHTAKQRATMLTVAWAVVTATIAALLVLLLGKGCSNEQPAELPPPLPPESTHSDALPPIAPPVAPPEATPTPIPGNTPQVPSPTPATASRTPLNINVPGITIVARDNQTTKLRFDEGIFSSLDTLSQDGRQLLDALSRQLPRNLAGWQMQIEGHTDNVPMRSTNRFENNEALALARARAAMTYLMERAAFPASALQARAGQQAPYPNDTADNRVRNRTITIEISPR